MKKEFMLQVKNDGEGKQIVSGRDLHKYLEVGRDFTTWIKERIEKYQFEESMDFTIVSSFPQNGGKGGRPKTDYVLRLNMAKELSMIENNDRGREARKYFIECENKLFDISKQLKQSCSDLKEIKIDNNFDWATKRIDDRMKQAKILEDQASYIIKKLQKVYEEIAGVADLKNKTIGSNFFNFKTPEKYDASKEPLPVIVELEIEKENLDKINELGLDKDKVLENTVKIFGQQKLSNKE